MAVAHFFLLSSSNHFHFCSFPHTKAFFDFFVQGDQRPEGVFLRLLLILQTVRIATLQSSDQTGFTFCKSTTMKEAAEATMDDDDLDAMPFPGMSWTTLNSKFRRINDDEPNFSFERFERERQLAQFLPPPSCQK